jgi:VIT1/CCC1 family predicted Fe2+/Mn2+ transporter
MMAKDALAAHARDELGISEVTLARPIQAGLASAASFSVGAAMPLLMVVISPAGVLADILRATLRVTFRGALAMTRTAGIGKLFGTIV